MKCPACRNLMIVVEYKDIELDYCPECQGIWFDTGELELLVIAAGAKGASPSLRSLLTTSEVKSNEKTRSCPVCARKMKKATIGKNPEVLIDACRQDDGLWFDRGEVEELVKQAEPESGDVVRFLGEVFLR